MKKIFTLAIVLFCTIAVHAQSIQKGTIFLGGNIGFNQQSVDSDNNDKKIRSTTFSLNPSAGRFYRSNRMFGVNINYSHQKRSDDAQKSNYYGVGIFLRQYIPLGKSFYLFLEEGLFGQTGKQEENNPLVPYLRETKYTGADLYVYPGVAYNITRKFQLELSLNRLLSINYNRQKDDYQNQNVTTKSTTTNFSFQSGAFDSSLGYLSLGLQWMIL